MVQLGTKTKEKKSKTKSKVLVFIQPVFFLPDLAVTSTSKETFLFILCVIKLFRPSPKYLWLLKERLTLPLQALHTNALCAWLCNMRVKDSVYPWMAVFFIQL